MRGKPGRACRGERQGRIIPARAGQTVTGVSIRSPPPDHPRACGANLRLRPTHCVVCGSSPRVRGKHVGTGGRRRRHRIIPARAGQTWEATRRPRPGSDHPRACGANHVIGFDPPYAVGSSPRVRGKLASDPRCEQRTRIIPARAGQTQARQRADFAAADHPRACGANSAARAPSSRSDGSSPRVRGKRYVIWLIFGLERIIPARAGQTNPMISTFFYLPDHPRACGANGRPRNRTVVPVGSSPRVRGKPLLGKRRVRLTRIIPARAGQTGPFVGIR